MRRAHRVSSIRATSCTGIAASAGLGLGWIDQPDDAAAKRIGDRPDRELAAGEVDQALEHASPGQQFIQRTFQMLVHRAIDAALIHDGAANRRIALHLPPIAGLFVKI